MTPASPLQRAAFEAALREDYGDLIVAVYTMSVAELEQLVEAAQMIDREGVELLDRQSSAERLRVRELEVALRQIRDGFPATEPMGQTVAAVIDGQLVDVQYVTEVSARKIARKALGGDS